MKEYYKDKLYISKVNDILEHPEFKKLENIIHHEGNRMNHSIRVSYHSYRICKFFHLDCDKVARAGLLHDFFFEDNTKLNIKDRLNVLINHPIYACNNAKKYFEISKLEEDIISSHMFPIGKNIPKYLESWVVDLVDDIEAIYEKGYIVFKQLSTAMCFIAIMFINILK